MAQLIPLFSVLLLLLWIQWQSSTACCAGWAWDYFLYTVDKTHFVYSWHIYLAGSWAPQKNRRWGSSLETAWRCFFKFKFLICLSTINFYFFSKKTGDISVPRIGTWNKASSKRNNNKTVSRYLCNCVASVLTEIAFVRNSLWQWLSPDKRNCFKATVLNFQHQISAQATPLMICQHWFDVNWWDVNLCIEGLVDSFSILILPFAAVPGKRLG